MKRIRHWICIGMVFLLLGAAMPVAFADSNVTFQGDAEKFVFEPGSEYSLTDLFTEFKGVMPGDTLTQTILIRNSERTGQRVRIYLRALGAHAGSEALLSELYLTVTDQQNNELFDAPADERAQLTDWVSLGSFAPGAEKELLVTLNVPIELDNRFNGAIGYLDWQFKAEIVPTAEAEAVLKPGDESGLPAYTMMAGVPKTGDETALARYAAMAVGALAALSICLRRIKKKCRR